MKRIDVKLPGNSYPIYLGKNIFKQLPFLIKNNRLNNNIFVIADKQMFQKNNTKVERAYRKLTGKKYFEIFKTSED